MTGEDAFRPADAGTRSVFVDSSALFALFHPGDDCHDSARRFHEQMRGGTLPYRRLVTNDYVLDEAATRLRRRVDHGRALEALTTVEGNDVYALEFTTPETFRGALARFVDFDDYRLSFTDCTIVSHMDDLGVDHLFSYDSDFAVFDCTVIPHYVA